MISQLNPNPHQILNLCILNLSSTVKENVYKLYKYYNILLKKSFNLGKLEPMLSLIYQYLDYNPTFVLLTP